MAFLYITEFANPIGISNASIQPVPGVQQTPVAEQQVAIAAGSTQSAALNAKTYLVRLQPDAVCSVLFAANPTATAANMRMAAGQTEYFYVGANSGLKIANITNT